MTTDNGFTGQRNEAGLMDHNARYYDPYLARFVSADTIVPSAGNPQSLNRFSYVVGNPLKYVDPSGHRYCVDVDENGRCIAWENPRTGEIEEAGGGGGQTPPPPWYAPAVVSVGRGLVAASEWAYDFTHNDPVGRVLMFPPIQLSHSGDIHSPKGLQVHYDSAFATFDATYKVKGRTSFGDSKGPRIDPSAITFRHGEIAESEFRWDTGTFRLKGIGGHLVVAERGDYVVDITGRAYVGGRPGPPYNYVVEGGAETTMFRFRGPAHPGDDLETRMDVSWSYRYELHGGPFAVAAVAALALVGGPYFAEKADRLFQGGVLGPIGTTP